MKSYQDLQKQLMECKKYNKNLQSLVKEKDELILDLYKKIRAIRGIVTPNRIKKIIAESGKDF